MKNRLVLLICFLIFTGLIGCDKLNLFQSRSKGVAKEVASAFSSAVKGTVIAKVNNAPIILEDMNKEVETYNAMVPADNPEAKITTRDQKIDYLKNEMVRRVLLYQDAMSKGLDRKEEILLSEEISCCQ